MRSCLIAVGGMAALAVAAVVVVGGTWLSYLGKEASLRNGIAAQQKANEASFDTMWKILSQQAGVADEYKQAFKDIYPQIIAGRYQGADGKGVLAKFVTESNPQFDTRLYLKLSNSIEAERKRFLTDQKKLLDMKREHDDLLDRPVSGLFLATLGGRRKIDVAVVTSDKADDAFRSGKDNDTDLFKKGK